MAFSTRVLPADPDAVSPGGGAEIRQLLSSPNGDLTHAVCRAGEEAPSHHLPELDEQYFILAGEGEIWRATDDREATTTLQPGRWVELPRGMRFRYRANRGTSLVFLVVVLPSWSPERFHTLHAAPWPDSDIANDWLCGDLPEDYDALAPDGSQIRLLGGCDAGSLSHCTLPGGDCTTAVRHRTVHEIWYVVDGHGEIWRCDPEGHEAVTLLAAGTAIDLPLGTTFQFRSTGRDPLAVIILTMPRWPGPDEAIISKGPWSATVGG
jgi:mannose-6-phosphate isomerase-like protein (cupin superfamily)